MELETTTTTKLSTLSTQRLARYARFDPPVVTPRNTSQIVQESQYVLFCEGKGRPVHWILPKESEKALVIDPDIHSCQHLFFILLLFRLIGRFSRTARRRTPSGLSWHWQGCFTVTQAPTLAHTMAQRILTQLTTQLVYIYTLTMESICSGRQSLNMGKQFSQAPTQFLAFQHIR